MIISSFPDSFIEYSGGGVMSEFSLLFQSVFLYIPYSLSFLTYKVPAVGSTEEASVRLCGPRIHASN